MYLNVLKILKDNIFCLYQFDIHFALLSVVVIAATSWLQWICKIDIPHRFAGGVACDAAVAAHASMLGSDNHPCRRPDICRPLGIFACAKIESRPPNVRTGRPADGRTTSAVAIAACGA